MTGRTIPQDTDRLPPGYRPHRDVDLKKDPGWSRAISALFVLTALLAVAVALLSGLDLGTGWSPFHAVPVTALACLLYMAVHEGTHGAVLRLLTGVRPTWAVRLPFLTTGTTAFLTRRDAVVVAVAPSVLWGAVLVASLAMLPQDWLLTAYVLTALNFAGSAGDWVEAVLVARQPPGALVRDDGDRVRVVVPAG